MAPLVLIELLPEPERKEIGYPMLVHRNSENRAAGDAEGRSDLPNPGRSRPEIENRRAGLAALELIRGLSPRALAFSRIAAWCFLIMVIALNLAVSPAHWVVVAAFGVLVPLVLMAQAERAISVHETRLMPRAEDKERELLDALGERGELTPTAAAMRTSMTLDETSETLEGLARKGHLEARAQDGAIVYALRERDLRELRSPPTGSSAAGGNPAAPSCPEPLSEPLSERELEVLDLLASGRTNREIARDLFVTVGTVKSHTSNIYGKLGTHNRAEALSKARSMGLLK